MSSVRRCAFTKSESRDSGKLEAEEDDAKTVVRATRAIAAGGDETDGDSESEIETETEPRSAEEALEYKSKLRESVVMEHDVKLGVQLLLDMRHGSWRE